MTLRYGALEGHSKPGLAKLFGEEIVQSWRSGLTNRPPIMTPQHLYYHGYERKYQSLFTDCCSTAANDGIITCTTCPSASTNACSLSPIPCTESLQDTIDRTVPLWDTHILPDLQAGRNVMIVAHRNSLRGIVKHIDGISTNDIEKMAFPNGIPLVYKFERVIDNNRDSSVICVKGKNESTTSMRLRPIKHRKAVAPLSGIWLEKAGLLRKALDHEEEMASRVEGYSNTSIGMMDTTATASASTVTTASTAVTSTATPVSVSLTQTPLTSDSPSPLVRSLSKLQLQRKTLNLVDSQDFDYPNITGDLPAYDTSPSTMAKTLEMMSMSSTGSSHVKGNTSYANLYVDPAVLTSAAYESIPSGDFLSSYAEHVENKEREEAKERESKGEIEKENVIDMLEIGRRLNQIYFFASNVPSVCVVKPPSTTTTQRSGSHSLSNNNKPLLVIIRHGKTEHNQLGLFTGWEDAMLAKQGREEALKAGKLLRKHGIEVSIS